jgi:hypothetical protein
MKTPVAKTRARIILDIPETSNTRLDKNDMGYIDGYVPTPNASILAVFVRSSDGLIESVPLRFLKAEDE